MILGKHTLDETRDELAKADYRFKEVGKAFDALINPPEDIINDWKAILAKWMIARKEIVRDLVLRAALFPSAGRADLIPTEDQYVRILGFTQFQENVKGSLQDVTNRIGKFRGKIIGFENQPKNTAGPDVDLELFKDLDAKTKEMDKAAEAAKKAAGEAASSNTAMVIGGTLLAAAAAKIYFGKF